jgi:type VI secretion system secreted protein VgrG
MLTVRDSQMKAMGDASPNKPVVRPCGDNLHWIEFQLVDQDNKAVPGEPYEVRLPDQSLRTGTLDNEGKVRFDGITAGQGTICFTGLDKREWQPLS